MLNKIKMIYNENSMWVTLTRHIFISFVLAFFAITIDTKSIAVLEYIPDLFLTSIDLAKLILSTLSGALLTITTFTFSTIMVVLTMYSSNFSPRVVNNFLTDKITMKVLGVFVGGFIYCILALFFMKNTYSSYLVISATIAVAYSIFCIIYFVIFVYNVSSSIQATKLIADIYEESRLIISRTLASRQAYKNLDEYDLDAFKHKLDVLSNKSGYLELIDFEELMMLLSEIDSILIIKLNIGDFISKNQSIATLYYNQDIKQEEIMIQLNNHFGTEDERIAYNDYRFSIQKIIDIALRAMSPGINDPNTSIHCINILGVILGELSEIEVRHTLIQDQSKKTKIIFEDFNFQEELYITFYQIINYGKKDISIVLAIFNALKTISRNSSAEKKQAISNLSDYVYESSIENFKNKIDIAMINKAQKQLIHINSKQDITYN